MDCQEEYCLEDEEGAAPGGAAAAEGHGDEAKPSYYSPLLKLIKQEEENAAFLYQELKQSLLHIRAELLEQK